MNKTEGTTAPATDATDGYCCVRHELCASRTASRSETVMDRAVIDGSGSAVPFTASVGDIRQHATALRYLIASSRDCLVSHP